ncbi:MAG: hypothetical protein JW863_18285 [Chitinispirillaceae bacterium]|nr:hypothetical protein [Chitinispirillaceae bacterium]
MSAAFCNVTELSMNPAVDRRSADTTCRIAAVHLLAGIVLSVSASMTIPVKPFEVAAPLVVPVAFSSKSWVVWPETGNADSLVHCLQSAVHASGFPKPGFDNRLTEAVCWHLLYRMGVDSGFAVSDRILRSLGSAGCSYPEVSWLNGINRVWSGEFKSGISILDRMGITEFRGGRIFSSDYLKILSRCFLPFEQKEEPIKVTLFSSASGNTSLFINPQEMAPVEYSISNQSFDNADVSSIWSLSAVYELTPVYSLRFPLLVERSRPQLELGIDSSITRNIIPFSLPDPFGVKSKMELKIITIQGNTGVSVREYLRSCIDNDYDQIWESQDMRHFNAISIRCRKRSIFRNITGTYYAFVVFDARISSEHARIRIKPVNRKIDREELPVRYVLAFRSSESIEGKAERIFQDILCKFETTP